MLELGSDSLSASRTRPAFSRMSSFLERSSRHGIQCASVDSISVTSNSSSKTPSTPFSIFRGGSRGKSAIERSAADSRPTRRPPTTAAALSAAADLPPSYVASCASEPRGASLNSSQPPSYSPRSANDTTNTANSTANTADTIATTSDDPFSFLRTFDTVFLVDDSGSMAGRSWRDTGAALAAIAPICTSHDSDGIDLHFLNHSFANAAQHTNLTTPAAVASVFAAVRPYGGTPTGARLSTLLSPYVARCAAHGCAAVRPLSIIVVTDGAAADDVESVLLAAARRLDGMGAPAWQVGVQFVQVGREPGAAEALRELDDGLAEEGGVRDMVDTVPWCEGGGDGGLSVERLMKVVLGALVRRLDRRRASGEMERERI